MLFGRIIETYLYPLAGIGFHILESRNLYSFDQQRCDVSPSSAFQLVTPSSPFCSLTMLLRRNDSREYQERTIVKKLFQ